MKRYIINILIAIDQFLNTVMGGDPDETISSRMGKHVAKKDSPFCNLICKLLNYVDPNHCTKSIEKDRGLPM